MIKEMFAAWRKRKYHEMRDRGYCWAAGQMLRGVSREQLEAKALGTFNRTWQETAFDSGVNSAILAADYHDAQLLLRAMRRA